MSEPTDDLRLEIAHILFIDIVGYSKLLMNEQSEVLQKLNQVVRTTEQFRIAEAAGKLIRIPVGDGMALVFFNTPEAPVRTAMEISEALRDHPRIRLRIGIHSGPVNEVLDVNDRSNVAGAGINMAQRVMDCGDAGRILLSKRVADDLAPFGHWRSQLHELGEVELKHGETVFLVNFYNDRIGNRQLPQKLKKSRQEAIGSAPGEPARTLEKMKRVSWLPFLIGGLALIFGGLFFLYRTLPKSGVTPPSPNAGIAASIPPKSIAVLPFENLSKDEENAFFAGGVQDEILSNLAKIADLKVISRTSVMKYKSGPERNLREIAKALGVAHVLEGSVQRAAGRVRVSAQLIDARDDAHLWAEHYDRDVADIFAIQTEIAQKIADQLRAKLSPGEKSLIDEKPTADLRAYELYNQARAILIYNDPASWERSLARKVELLEQAIQRDPHFALAYCALAKAHCDFETAVHNDLAKKTLDGVLRIRPELGEAHRELGRYYSNLGDYERASEELTVARRSLPNDAEVLRVAGEVDRARNRWDDALANLQKANELDPRNGEITHHLWVTYYATRRYHEAEQFLDKAFARDPEYIAWFPFYRAWDKLAVGDPAGAKKILAQVPHGSNPPVIWLARFESALYLRDYDEMNRVLAQAPVGDSFTLPFFIGKPPQSWANGLIARLQGEKEKALATFAAGRKSFDEQWGNNAKDHNYFTAIARVDADLGRKEDAVREAQRAVELMPLTRNSYEGAPMLRNLAMVYAMVGERDSAIEQLAKVAKIPSGQTYGDLRFNPVWDSLRGDRRFDKIVALLEPK